VEGTGFKVAATVPEQTVKAIAAAMMHLSKDPTLWQQMSQTCRQHASSVYSWTVKVEGIAQLYQDIITQQKPQIERYPVSP
jgi:glycosyltransferase involved in cell wall biosynthesis